MDSDKDEPGVAEDLGGHQQQREERRRPSRSSESRQSSLSVGSGELRMLGDPISDRSDESSGGEEAKKPKTLVDEEGRNVIEEEEEDSLEDFEEQEREVARQLDIDKERAVSWGEEEEENIGGGLGKLEEEEEQDEDEQQQSSGGTEGSRSYWEFGADDLPRSSQSRISESLHNRQFSGAEVLRDEPNLSQAPLDSSGSLRSSPGYPVDYPTDPPPAYTSPRAISRGRLFVGERPGTSAATAFGPMLGLSSAEQAKDEKNMPAEEEEEEEGERKEHASGQPLMSQGFAVPSPRFQAARTADGADSSGGESERRGSADIKKAIGSSFALAGGMAAAVAAAGGIAAAGVQQKVQKEEMVLTGRAAGAVGGMLSSPRDGQSPRLLVQGARTAADLTKGGASRPDSARSSAGQERTGTSSGGGQQQTRPAAEGEVPNQQHSSRSRFPVSAELKSLFRLMEEFVAERVDIEPVLKPFQIDYIPAVGDVDPFIKVVRPDDNDELQLGLAVLDEPAAIQSDRAIVDLRLHQMAGKGSSADMPVKKLSRADKNAHQIDRWVQSVRELRRTKAPDRVHYSRPMPSIDELMQEWPVEVEQSLKGMQLLMSAKLDAALEDYVDLCLALVDIPVHKNRLEALHLFFSLYAEFRNSQHFRNLALGQSRDADRNETVPTTIDNNLNRLEIGP